MARQHEQPVVLRTTASMAGVVVVVRVDDEVTVVAEEDTPDVAIAAALAQMRHAPPDVGRGLEL